MYSLPCFVAIAPFLLFDTSHVLSGQHFTNNDLDIVVVRRAWSMLPLSIAYTCTLFRISLVLHCDINIRSATLILTSFDLVSCPRNSRNEAKELWQCRRPTKMVHHQTFVEVYFPRQPLYSIVGREDCNISRVFLFSSFLA